VIVVVGGATITDCSSGLQKRTVMNYLPKCNKRNNLAVLPARLFLCVNWVYLCLQIFAITKTIASANICNIIGDDTYAI
jgi:hypothetical protein